MVVDTVQKDEGIVPFNCALLFKESAVSCTRFPNVDGTVPVN